MSEIKGQLLGVLLVVSIFGAIGFTLYSAFKGAADKVTESFNDFDPSVNPELISAASAMNGDLTF